MEKIDKIGLTLSLLYIPNVRYSKFRLDLCRIYNDIRYPNKLYTDFVYEFCVNILLENMVLNTPVPMSSTRLCWSKSVIFE